MSIEAVPEGLVEPPVVKEDMPISFPPPAGDPDDTKTVEDELPVSFPPPAGDPDDTKT